MATTNTDACRFTLPPRSLVLGFAFSMTAEGLPGSYNERLAAQLSDVISAASGLAADERPWIGVQWEIFDALEAGWDASRGNLTEFIPLEHVGAPPLFRDDDIASARAIGRFLRDCRDDATRMERGEPLRLPTTRAGRAVVQRLLDLPGQQPGEVAFFENATADGSQIATCFNRLLRQDDLHHAFHDSDGCPFLALHDLYRTRVGSVGVEKRTLPGANERLRRFQRLRVNRLILEAIFPQESVLKSGKYLSTKGVLTHLHETAHREGAGPFAHVFLFGHPAHSPRCRRQFLESEWLRALGLDEKNVHDVNSGRDAEWLWDPITAQMCCRSRADWDDYERMHQAQWD